MNTPPVGRLAFLALLFGIQPVQTQETSTRATRSSVGPIAQRPSAIPEDWFARVSTHIRREEYRFSRIDSEEWSAPNRSHELRIRVNRERVEVFPRETDASGTGAAWKLSLGTASFGRVGDVRTLERGRVSVEGERAQIDHGALVEWFVNDDRGIEHGWTISDRRPGVGPLVIGLAIEGALSLRLDDGLRSGAFVDGSGEVRARYVGLKAWDATGRELESHMQAGPAGVEVRVDDSAATYPVTVDPLLTNATWTAESNQVDAQFGVSVSAAGDVNGDGYSDVIVGAHFYDNGESNEGRAYVYHGSASGLSFTAAWTAESNLADAQFGRSVSSAGDVNGDGYSDVVVGAHLYANGESDEGRAYVYHGSPAGLGTSESWAVESNQSGAFFGVSVSTAGDVNGDGYSDVIVGARLYDDGESDEGRAFVYHGSAAGLETTEAWTAESNQVDADFGSSVSTAGDVNGDGYSDVIVGARLYDNGESNEGRAYVYHGSASGLDAAAAWTAESNQATSRFGASVSTAGDVNGDGYADVIVGARQYDNGESNEGRAYVYHGSMTGLAGTAAWTAESNQVGANFGVSVSTAGDVNGDSCSDVIIGAHQYDGGESDEGRAFLYHGSTTGLESTEAWTAESNQASGYFGYSVSTAGDINSDGYADVIVGAQLYDGGESDEGRAYVYHGKPSGLAPTSAWSALGCTSAAGDFNGDGFSDLVVGYPLGELGVFEMEGAALVYYGSSTGPGPLGWLVAGNQDFARMGESVAACDVNGDGYSDVIVGSPGYDQGETDEGVVRVWHGSANGLPFEVANWEVQSNSALGYLGESVSNAGDVNGDGYSDVIVGQAGSSRAYVWHGSAGGLMLTPDWQGDHQVASRYGYPVSTAGDVNGDGYSDVIVGAALYDNGESDEGGAFVYHGSPAGIGAVEAWNAESNQANAEFGAAVSTAGDVNGDGYSDVIVGAPGYDNGESDEGRAYLYQGSARGLSPTATWVEESNTASGFFGFDASSADVNGDGYSDVIVGTSCLSCPTQVYLGSAAGLNSSATAVGGAGFGDRVSGTGDVNGDGYSDVVLGDGSTVALHYGNGGHGGLVRSIQQRDRANTRPISLLGEMTSSGLFHLRASFPQHIAADWLVPDKRAWLEWEVKPLGVAFDGNGIQRGAERVLNPAGGDVTFDELAGSGPSKTAGPRKKLIKVSPGNLYHWRARFATNNPLFAHTAWFSVPGNNLTESKIRRPPSLR